MKLTATFEDGSTVDVVWDEQDPIVKAFVELRNKILDRQEEVRREGERVIVGVKGMEDMGAPVNGIRTVMKVVQEILTLEPLHALDWILVVESTGAICTVNLLHKLNAALKEVGSTVQFYALPDHTAR